MDPEKQIQPTPTNRQTSIDSLNFHEMTKQEADFLM